MADTQTASTNTDTGQVSYADFASKIRAKYPNSKLYKSKPDKELVDAWIQAKPERAVYVKKIKGYDPDNTGGKGVPSGIPQHTGSHGQSTTVLLTASQVKEQESKTKKAADYVGAGLPSTGGFIGGIVGGGKGPIATVTSGVGGAIGAGLRDIEQRIVLDKNIDNKTAVLNMLKEGGIQAGLQYGGEKVGDVFFHFLNKIPHAVIKQGIKLLPSDLEPNGKVMKYVEDLLSNLAPSTKTIESFKTQQSADIIKKVNTIVGGFSKFNGTSEEMGVLLQKTLQTGQDAIEDKLSTLEKGYIKKGASKLQAQMYVRQTAVYKEYVQKYENELVKQIVATNKPELIAGLLRSSKAALNETRVMSETLKKLDGDMLGKVQNRLMRDIISETLTGSKDPTAKGVQNLTAKYSGNKFKAVLDNIGEEKLKAIYGEAGYKQIEEFVKLTGTIGNTTSGSGVGRFLNLTFLLPFRGGMSGKAIAKVTGMAALTNRAAKVITSTEGMRLYENIIRSTSVNAPKAAKLAIDEYNKFIQRQDEEFIREQKQTEDQYYIDHPDEVKYRDIDKNKEN